MLYVKSETSSDKCGRRPLSTATEHEHTNTEHWMTAIEHLIEHCKPHRAIVRAALLQSMLEINSPFHVLIHLHLGSRLCGAVEPLLQSMVIV